MQFNLLSSRPHQPITALVARCATAAALALVGAGTYAAGPAWTQYGGDPGRTFHQPNETKLTADNVSALKRQWKYVPTVFARLGYPLYGNGRVGLCMNESFLQLNALTGHQAGQVDLGYQCSVGALSTRGLLAESYWPVEEVSTVKAVARDGSTRWAVQPGGTTDGLQAPAVTKEAVYVADRATGVYAYRASNGALLWQQDIGPRGENAGPPVVANGKVIVTRTSTSITDMRPRIFAYEAATGALSWSVGPDQLEFFNGYGSVSASNGVLVVSSITTAALNMATGQIIWQTGSGVYGSVAIAGNVVYIVGSCHAQAMDLQTGAVIWHHDRVGCPLAPSKLVVANGMIFFAEKRGFGTSGKFVLQVLRASTGVAIPLNNTLDTPAWDEAVATSLAVVDGMVLMTGTQELHAFGLD